MKIRTFFLQKVVLIIILFFAPKIGFSQTDTLKTKQLYFELGGFGGHYSLNYSREIYKKNQFRLNLGIGFTPSLFEKEFSPRFPIRCEGIYKINKHRIEAGIGVTPFMYYDNEESLKENLGDFEIALLVKIGYSYPIINQKYIVGIAFTPAIYDAVSFDFQPWGAIKFGYEF